MKTKTIVFLTFLTFGATILNAQQKVTEKALLGNWKLVIEIDEALDEAKKELDEDDNAIAKLVLSSVSGFVEGIIDEIDIYFEFKKNGQVVVYVEAFGEKETEYSNWSIDKQGRLHITDTDSFNNGDGDYWMLKDSLLVNIDDNEDDKEYVYMVNID